MKQEQKMYAIVGGIILLFILYITFYLMKQKEGMDNKPDIKSTKTSLDKTNNDLTAKIKEDAVDILALIESMKTNIILNNIDEIVSGDKLSKFSVSDMTSIENYLKSTL